jgi:hypothetical protein
MRRPQPRLKASANFIQEETVSLPSLHMAAQEFAPGVLRSSNRSSLDAVMQRVSRSMGIGLSDAYHRLSASVAYGFLQLDHNYELDTDLRLHLVRSGRRSTRPADAPDSPLKDIGGPTNLSCPTA